MLCLWVLKCLAVAAGVKRPWERGSLDLNRHPQTQQLWHRLLIDAGKHYGPNSVPVMLVTSRLAPWNMGNLFPSSFSCSRLPPTLFEPLLFCAPSSQVFYLTFFSSFFSIPSSINNGWHSCRLPHLVTFEATKFIRCKLSPLHQQGRTVIHKKNSFLLVHDLSVYLGVNLKCFTMVAI